MKNIEEIMRRFSQAELSEGVRRVKELMSTPEGEQIRRKLAGMDKTELMRRLNTLDASSRSDRKGSSMSNKDILDKLNQFCDRK